MRAGVRDERRVGVAGQVDLRDQGDVPGGRVGDDPPVVRLGVVPAGAAADLARPADGGQLRPGVDGDAPPLVVGEVQVQVVELVAGEVVDHLQDVLDGEEVSRHVEHRAPVGEAGAVQDRAAGQRPARGHRRRALHGGGEQLPERLDAVEEAGWGAGDEAYPGAGHVEPVALRPEVGG